MKKPKIINKKQSQSHFREIQIDNNFQNQFQDMLSRQHTKQFHLIDTPNLIYSLSQIRPYEVPQILKESLNKHSFNHRKQNSYNQNQQNQKKFINQKNKKNSFSVNRNSFSFVNKDLGERDKYKGIKQKLSFFIQNIQQQKELNLSQIIEYKQIILRDFLSSIIQDLKRQCKEKGELIEFVWNNMFLLINKILSALTDKKKIIQKLDLQQTLKQHQQYQKLIEINKRKFDQTALKSVQAETIIRKLVDQLRFKKKQVKKLYSSLRSCHQNINEFKYSYFDLQTQHIDLLMSAKDLSKQQAIILMQKKEQINKQAHIEVRLNSNKKNIQRQIKLQLSKQNSSFSNKKDLVKDLKQLVQLQNFDQKSAFISELVQSFSPNVQNQQCLQVIKMETKHNKKQSVATQMHDFFKFSTYLQSQSSQTTYSDKIQNQLICTKTTQTQASKLLKKTFQNKQIQADGDAMRIILIKRKLLIYRTLNLDFYFSERYRQNVKPSLTFQPISNYQSQIQRNSKISQSLLPKSSQQTLKINLVKKSYGKRKNEKTASYIYDKERKSLYQQTKSANKKQKSQLKKLNQRKSQQSLNIQPFINQKPEDELLNQGSQMMQNTLKSFSIKRHRSSIFAQGQNADLIEYNQNKQNFIQRNLRNRKKQYFVMQRSSILKSFKQNLNQKQNDKFNSTLLQRQTRTFFPNKTTLSNFSNLKCNNFKLKKDENLNNLGRFKATFQNFSNFNGSNVTSPLIQKTIDKILKKSLIKITSSTQNYKQCKEMSSSISIFNMLNPLIKDVLEMMNNQSEFFKKKHRNNINIKNSYKILMMVYAKAFDMINRKIVLQTLAPPLFQTFQVLYGTLKIQDIYKKMIAFIVGIVSTQNNQIFKTFCFFFGLQNLTNSCSSLKDKITTADTILFLKLLEKLSLGSKVGTDIQNSYTTIQKVKSSLSSILIQQQMPQVVIRQLQMSMQRKLGDFEYFLNQRRQNKQIDEQNQTKLNLFKMARIIVQQNIKIRLNLIQSFEPLLNYWNAKLSNTQIDNKNSNVSNVNNLKDKNVLNQTENQSQKQKICVTYVKKIIKCCKSSSVDSFEILKHLRQTSKFQQNIQEKQILIQEIQMNLSQSENINKSITKNEFASILLKLNILNIQQIFKINLYQLQNYKTCSKVYLKNQQTNYSPTKIQNFHNEKQNLTKIQFLCRLEDQTNIQLQHILGDIKFLYHLSIFSIIPQNQKISQL